LAACPADTEHGDPRLQIFFLGIHDEVQCHVPFRLFCCALLFDLPPVPGGPSQITAILTVDSRKVTQNKRFTHKIWGIVAAFQRHFAGHT
jgi:hypothetical protein